jgi:flagellar M-ring protein FliF
MSAVAELSAAPLASATPAWVERLGKLNRTQRLRLGLGVALLVVAGIAGTVMGRQAEYRVLFSNLADKDGGAIVAQLSTMNVPYKYSEGGGAIMVPADRVHDLRLRLAAQGLPKGSVAGFELMEGNRFGMTQFQERLTFQRGLEGELTRSIQSLASVQTARVHLALPNQTGFFREQQKPSASVLVTLQPGASLDRSQIAGIVHLVASSVPEMLTAAVSVLDDSGKLLSAPPDGTPGGIGGAGGDAQQLQYVQQLEQSYTRRVLDMLEPVVGRGNVKATVTADVDFSQTEQTSEQHKPNQTADAGAIRSQQVIESSGPTAGGATQPAGVPGATTNQPPTPPAAPINGQAQPLTAGAGNTGTTAAEAKKRESITNYEVDKTVRVVRGGTAAVKRLSAAVVVNYQPAAEGAKGGPTALSAQQIEQMTALVRESIGFSKDRGDSVNLMNAPFQVAVTDTTTLPLWKQPEMLDLARSMAWPVGTFLFGALVLLGFIRPALKSMNAPKVLVPGDAGFVALDGPTIRSGSQLDVAIEDDVVRGALGGPAGQHLLLPPTPEQLRLEDAKALARSNPIAVANIVKEWVSGEAPA